MRKVHLRSEPSAAVFLRFGSASLTEKKTKGQNDPQHVQAQACSRVTHISIPRLEWGKHRRTANEPKVARLACKSDITQPSTAAHACHFCHRKTPEPSDPVHQAKRTPTSRARFPSPPPNPMHASTVCPPGDLSATRVEH